MAVLLANNATSRLASSLTASATTLSVTTGQGSRFPSPSGDQWFPLTLIKASGVLEILKCTARSGDVFTVVRAQEGTASQSFSAGDRVEIRATKAVFESERQDAKDYTDELSGVAVKKDASTSTGAALIPAGADAQRPGTPVNGMFRYNSEKNQFEGYQNGKWGQVGGGDAVLTPGWALSRASIGDGYAAQDGQLLSRATYPDAWAQAQAIGMVITDAEWQADPLKRGFFSDGDGSTTFRLPDANGKQAGSLGAVFLRGDGALSAGQAGLLQQDALQNITGNFSFGYGYREAVASTGGAFASEKTSSNISENSGSGSRPESNVATFDASRVARTADETRPLSATVVWTIKLFGAVVNVGSADAAQLASDYANLAAALQSDIDFTIIYPNGGSAESPANVTAASRYVQPNPFPGHQVVCDVQLLLNDKWGSGGFRTDGTTGFKAFAVAHQYGDNELVLQTGQNGVASQPVGSGSPHALAMSVDALTSAPARIRVWKIKGAIA